MKKRSKILLVVLSLAGVLGTQSCTKVLDNLANLNVDPTKPLSASSPTLLAAAEFGGVQLDQGSFVTNGDGDGFFGVFTQHMAGNHAQGLNYNTYTLTHKSFQFLFNDAYVSSLMNLKQLIANAKPGEEAYIGIAQILEAYQLGYLTSVYGDIPWTEALDVNQFPSPSYDTQESIYAAVQNLLSAGIANLELGGDASNGDIIYQGDNDKWISAAYLLKARYYNHFSKKDPTGSATNALKYVDSALDAGFATNGVSGDLTLPYDGATGPTTNPWISMYNNSMLVANIVYLNHMIAEDDPRISANFTSIEYNGNDVYGLGQIISGTVGTGLYMQIGPASDPSNDPYNFYGQPNSPVEMATYPELLMIKAEANFRLGNLAEAAQASNDAVTAQINQVVTDPAYIPKIAPYLAAHASETAGTITLEKIMTEKYKLMFTMFAESWMDLRRTDYKYPNWLTIPVVDVDVVPNVPVSATYIQRLLYPQSELDNNPSKVPQQSADAIYTPLPILQ